MRLRARNHAYKPLCELKFESIIPSFSPDRQRALRRSLNGKTSTWLNVLPLQNYHFDLSPLQFRDGLAIRYLRDPPCLPPKFDGCGTALTLQHALDCKKGGLVIQRHNEIRVHRRYSITGMNTCHQRTSCQRG